jgi:hypothetical protein
MKRPVDGDNHDHGVELRRSGRINKFRRIVGRSREDGRSHSEAGSARDQMSLESRRRGLITLCRYGRMYCLPYFTSNESCLFVFARSASSIFASNLAIPSANGISDRLLCSSRKRTYSISSHTVGIDSISVTPGVK